MMRSRITKTLACGATLTLASIKTQQDLIALDLVLTHDDLLGVQHELTRHVLSHDMEDEDGVPLSTLDLFDCAVGQGELSGIAQELRAASMPSEADLKSVTEMALIIGRGGCECRVCRGHLNGRKLTERIRSMCKFYGVPPRAYVYWRLASPHRHASLLAQPPALTAIMTAIKVGEGLAVRERIKERERDARLQRVRGR